MKKWAKITVAVVAVAVIAGAGTWEYLTSAASSDPCSGVNLGLPTGSSTAVAYTHSPDAIRGGAPATTIPRGQSLALTLAGPLQVVAAENFWGSLVRQLGGNQTTVLSIVTDPNADPHEYEANASDAKAIASAQYVVVNGVGYDDWALQLIAADGNSNQLVLNVGTLNGVNVGGGIVSGNPHMWYNPVYVNRTVAAMFSNLVELRPSATPVFQANYAALNVTLGQLYARAEEIRTQFAGTVVAATEDIFVYLANYTQLDLVSPPAFMEAVAEGNDPPAQSVVQFQCQLESGKVHVLVYNEQTVTPITSSMKAIAAANNVSVVGVTETIQPSDVTFQVWMNAEYLSLQNALNANALGH
ncbi:MAG TPA: zinc ABC transporter substrate-binding protein [Thermoplasmata archaeon]|nr:zinc ABC transporter substrate-binding protein [Thermoplasmata archaeon]